MSFVVKETQGQAGDRAGPVYELSDAAGTVRAEVWPQWGFNCIRWQVRQADGRWADIIYAMPDWETNPVPTRSGHPILFPFPGRLKEGKLPYQGQTVQLPLTESSGKHSIHGFTPRVPWRVGGTREDETFASVTGLFALSDAPGGGPWPADFELALTYELHPDKLRVVAEVTNRGPGPLPFGLGYHPYFRLPGVNDADVGGHVLQANVAKLWAVDANNLPTGSTVDVPTEIDFQTARPLGDVKLDHVLTGVTTQPTKDGLREVAVLTHPRASGRLRFLFDPAFGDLVLFIPAHRQAVAVEPYSCSADASNLAEAGVDSHWRMLAPWDTWRAAVEYRWEPVEL